MSGDVNRKRAPNFSTSEKTVLLNIINTCKSIIECKKTNGTTWRQKDEAWNKICAVVNSNCPGNYPRNKESLKKFFDNMKKNVRKEIAAERNEVVKTGGGKSESKLGRDPTIDLALTIMNEKTVYGLVNHFDSDYTPKEQQIDKESQDSKMKSLMTQKPIQKGATTFYQPLNSKPQPGSSQNNPTPLLEIPKNNQPQKTWLIMSKRTRKTDKEIREAVDTVVNQDDFLASSVTDRPYPCNKETQEQDIQDMKCNDLPEVGVLDIVSQSTSSANLNTESKPSNSCRAELNLISPEVLRPYPKAMPRKSVQVNRKKGKSAIITDTPGKDDLMKAYEEKAKKQKQIKALKKAKVLAKRTKKI
ncbi:hypothetical protein JTB14_024548 [Gonioctena quinquepunctata]|nr:hypothetical protein JTB14_024548 [Gonioctena quinquepunctata]